MTHQGLYVHIPFCLKKCDYCDFCSFPGIDEDLQKKYIKALQKEIEFDTGPAAGTIYIGGGTPTSLSKKNLLRLMEAIGRPSSSIEYSVESNPGTIDFYKLKILKDAGVNRLSIGAQSFNDDELRSLGRVHDCEEIYESYEAAIRAGFSNINIDLMFALPGQTLDDWTGTLKKAVKLRPKHISAYNLQIEEGTPLSAGSVQQDNETEYRMYKETIDFLKSEGYIHYEISNFCLPGFECKHNINYWENGDYKGFGLSASSHIKGARHTNTKDLQEYISDPITSKKKEKRVKKDEIAETMFMGLRLIKGMDLSRFEKRFKKPAEELFGKEIRELSEKGLLEQTAHHLRLTDKGLFVANEVFEQFV